MPSPTWKGTSGGIKLQPNSPQFKRDGSGATLTFVFRGRHSALKAYGPAIADELVLNAFDYTEAYPDEILYASAVELKPDGAGDNGPGTLTITYSNEVGSVIGITDPGPTYEVEWVGLEKKLESHPLYDGGATINGTSFGGAKLSTTVLELSAPVEQVALMAIWEILKNVGTTKQRNDLILRLPEGNGKDLLLHLEKKWKSGVESYVLPAPVARKTTRNYVTPGVSACGKRRTTVPFSGAPTGYQWLKMADRAVRQGRKGKWEKVEEWSGAERIDTDLYPTE